MGKCTCNTDKSYKMQTEGIIAYCDRCGQMTDVLSLEGYTQRVKQGNRLLAFTDEEIDYLQDAINDYAHAEIWGAHWESRPHKLDNLMKDLEHEHQKRIKAGIHLGIQQAMNGDTHPTETLWNESEDE